jgi:hypothetical protein
MTPRVRKNSRSSLNKVFGRVASKASNYYPDWNVVAQSIERDMNALDDLF